MSLLIKGLNMPESCMVCHFGDALMGKGFCYVSHCKQIENYFVRNDRPSWCPLVELPPHGRLIDADDIKSITVKLEKIPLNNDWVLSSIDAPTIIEAEDE